MKKRVVLINGMILLIMFSFAGMAQQADTDPEQMEKLLAGRIEILNDYYSQKTDFAQTRDKLAEVEAALLLQDDLIQMDVCAGTDIERVAEADVEITACSRNSYGMIKGNAVIKYRIIGQAGTWHESREYYFTGEEQQEKIKLTQLNVI